MYFFVLATTFAQKMPAIYLDQIKESADYINQKIGQKPSTLIILGSGLGSFSEDMDNTTSISYADIPHFPVSTVEGHKGHLIHGTIGDKQVWVMAGRFHYYEGYTAQQVAYPVRVMRSLGVDTLLLSNAAGGVGEGFQVGDLMIIRDHISFFTENPLIGPNESAIGTRFPDMSEPYSSLLIKKAYELAQKNGLTLKEGVYVGVTGPTFETHAEYRFIKAIGGHAVGMSTVQEVIAAVHCGMKVFGMSVITDLGIRDNNMLISHEDVLLAAKQAEPKLSLLFRELLQSI